VMEQKPDSRLPGNNCVAQELNPIGITTGLTKHERCGMSTSVFSKINTALNNIQYSRYPKRRKAGIPGMFIFRNMQF